MSLDKSDNLKYQCDYSGPDTSRSPLQCRSKRRRLQVKNVFHHPLFDQVDTSPATDGLPSIHVLNDDCLDMILSCRGLKMVDIFRLSLVCRRWYNLCMQKISRIDSFSINRLGEELHGINYKWDPDKSIGMNSVMSVVSLNCGSLTSLLLADVWDIDASSLIEMIEFLPNVINLVLSAESLLEEDTVDVIGQKLIPQIESLEMSACNINLNPIISCVLQNARRLFHLSLSTYDFGRYEHDAGHVDLYQEGANCIPEVLSPDNPISSLSLELSKLHPGVLEYFIKTFSTTLEYLNLSRNDPGTVGGIEQVESLPKLNNMKIFLAYVERVFRYRDLTTYSTKLVSFLKLMPNLRVLNLSWNFSITFCSYDIVQILANHCPLLEELNLSYCWIPAENMENLKKLQHLKRLCVDYISVYHWDIRERLGLPDHNLVWRQSMRFLATKVLPFLKSLEYVSMKNNEIALPADDITLFLANAGPCFKGLYIGIPAPRPTLDCNSKYDLLQEVLKKCSSLSRSNLLTITIEQYSEINFDICDDEEEHDISYYNEIAPRFIRVLGGDHGYKCFESHFAADEYGCLASRHVYGQYIKVPLKLDIRPQDFKFLSF